MSLTPIDPATFVTRRRADDPRLGEVARSVTDLATCRAGEVVIIGVPDDRGVIVNGGRSGAARGPQAFREAFYRLPGEWHMADAGDIVPGTTNRETHEALAHVVAEIIRAGALPLVIGGSHDHTYGGIKGVLAAGRRLGLINCDPHLDLRPAEAQGDVNSGSSFRRLLDEQLLPGAALAEYGWQPHANSAQHLDWARDHGVRLWSGADARLPSAVPAFLVLLRDLPTIHGSVAVSFDLDVIDAAAAPGVSAPATLGWSPAEAIVVLQHVGQEPRLTYLDLMELNPAVDDGRTARLAATLVWYFLQARAQPPLL